MYPGWGRHYPCLDTVAAADRLAARRGGSSGEARAGSALLEQLAPLWGREFHGCQGVRCYFDSDRRIRDELPWLPAGIELESVKAAWVLDVAQVVVVNGAPTATKINEVGVCDAPAWSDDAHNTNIDTALPRLKDCAAGCHQHA
jgi:hypothetical protein